MDKRSLNERLNNIKGDMSAEEIEKTIEILTLMKTDVRRYDNTAKARKTRLLATTQKRDAKVSFIGLNRQKGFLNLMGASLLTYRDYLPLASQKIIRQTSYPWWLYDGMCVGSDSYYNNWNHSSEKTAAIRPVLIIDSIEGNLSPKDVFDINEERFMLLNPMIALRMRALDDMCTYKAPDYMSSVIKMCVDGWYANLTEKNEKNRLRAESKAV